MNIYDTSALAPVGAGTVLASPQPTSAGFDWGGMAGVATQLIGGLAGAFATDAKGQNDYAYEMYQAEVAEINRGIKLDQQKDIVIQGQIQIAEHTRQVGDAIASNIVKQGGSGFQIAEDSIGAISRMGDRQGKEIGKNIENAYMEVGYEALGLSMSEAGHKLSAENKKSSARTTALTQGVTAIGSATQKLGAFMPKRIK